MSRREVRTRDLNDSIWLNLTEEVFRRHLVVLEGRTNAVPIAPLTLNPADWLPTSPYVARTEYTLPLEVEQKLADDFAFLAAVEEGAQSVAAVCIEERAQVAKLTLRFAALDLSLNLPVKNYLRDISLVLSRAAAQTSSDGPDHASVLFKHIICLHFHRLLARLRSCKWEKPKYLSKSHKKALWQDFENLVHRTQFTYSKIEKATRELTRKLLGDLATVYQSFESVSTDEVAEMAQLVEASFVFCSTPTIQDYLQRLEGNIGSKMTPQVAAAIKSLRQIQKVAAYRRISISLINVARDYPKLFQAGIALEYLTPYQSVPSAIGYEEWAKTCHVHAEVQLAIHYDLTSQQNESGFLRPRAIGISKSLCYLCYHFLRAHKGFFPSRTHGRLYDQWTLPDLAELDDNTARRYRQILKDINDEVVRHAEEEPEMWRIEPMTSIDVYSAAEAG